MNRFLLAASALFLLLLIGCGGGGGGGSSTGSTGASQTVFSGLVYDVTSGVPVTPGATVTIGGKSATSDPDFGNFSVTAARTSNTVSVATTAYGTSTFSFPSTTDAELDLGVLYVGPEKVTVTGNVTDATTNEPIPGAIVQFAGRYGTAGADGRFSIPNVAYSSDDQSGFFGISGLANATGYVAATFNANGVPATGGVVEVGNVRLFSNGDVTPPEGPYNLTGLVSNVPDGEVLVVELLQGATVLRTSSGRTDDRFFFWIEPGTYTLRATAGTLTRSVPVTVTATNVIKTLDFSITTP